MVALTPSTDNFKKICIIAIVAARPLDNVTAKPPSVDLFFSRPEDIQVDPQLEFVMIEARSGYYEGSRHTLRALQKLHRERLVLFPYAKSSPLTRVTKDFHLQNTYALSSRTCLLPATFSCSHR
jgi:hypothetical protein